MPVAGGVTGARLILGILSDTHGRAERAARAMGLLRRLGAEAFIHCGDVGSPEVLDALYEPPAPGAASQPCWFVWGNTDAADDLADYARLMGRRTPTAVPTRVELAGKRIAVFHGHEPAFWRLTELLDRRDTVGFAAVAACDYLLYGHTHLAADARAGGVRLINPGALHRARPHTVATLDLAHDAVEHWVVDEADEGSGRFPQKYRLE